MAGDRRRERRPGNVIPVTDRVDKSFEIDGDFIAGDLPACPRRHFEIAGCSTSFEY